MEGETLNDVELSHIDFEWVEKQTKASHLKKALKLLEIDGNYYPELSSAIQEKLKKIDPKYKYCLDILLKIVEKGL